MTRRIFIIACLLAFLAACSKNVATDVAVSSPTPILTVHASPAPFTATPQPVPVMLDVSQTPIPTYTFTPTPVPFVIPDVLLSSQEAEEALLKLLKTNGNCTGKCVAGIRPGEMNVQEAVNIMTQWGVVRKGKNSLGQTFINLVQDPLYGQIDVRLSVGTWTKELETIDRASFYLGGLPGDLLLGEDIWLANHDLLMGYQLENILEAYGIPSYVGSFFQTTVEIGTPLEGRTIAYTMDMHYEQTNLMVSIGAMAYYDGENLFLCPSKDPHDLGIVINPERSLKKLEEFQPVTWQALTDTDLEAFYQMFTDDANLDACITTTLEKVQALQPSFR